MNVKKTFSHQCFSLYFLVLLLLYYCITTTQTVKENAGINFVNDVVYFYLVSRKVIV